MWVMTHFGILMPSLRPGDKFDPAQDDRHIQIRARRARDIDYLRANYAPYLGDTIFIGDTDYQYRAYCTHAQLAEIMGLLALEIDYVKFKPTTDRHKDKELHALYNRVWGCVLDAFPEGSSWNEPKFTGRAAVVRTPARKLTRKEKRALKKAGARWQNIFTDEVSVDATTGYNEYADANPVFRKNWWEDL